MSDVHALRGQLVGAVELLAAPAELQLKHLHALGSVSVDELALEFDDVSGAMLQSGSMSPPQAKAVAELAGQLRLMSGRERSVLWTEEALERSPHWETVRRLARDALSLMR